MSRKFEVGDLALTIYPIPSVPAGTVIQLDQRLSLGDVFRLSGEMYVALADGWICSKPDIESRLAYAESSLMPLRGDFAPEQQKSHAVPA